MFAWIDLEIFDHLLNDEILTTALEWGDYELAIQILEQTGAISERKDDSVQTLFAKLHLLAIVYERQGSLDLAERLYDHALNCVMSSNDFDPLEVRLFFNNYSGCLQKMHKFDLADGMRTVAETFPPSCTTYFASLHETEETELVEVVANVA